MNNASAGSFLGISYQRFEDNGEVTPGVGDYAVERSTMILKGPSVLRSSTFNRRTKTSCAPMEGSRIVASLTGLDQLLLEQVFNLYLTASTATGPQIACCW
jgi:hypothetical protein